MLRTPARVSTYSELSTKNEWKLQVQVLLCHLSVPASSFYQEAEKETERKSELRTSWSEPEIGKRTGESCSCVRQASCFNKPRGGALQMV